MSSVPEEIYLEILLRVPVRSTYVCKCVCKSWFHIISNPSFVKMHLDISLQRKNYNLMFDRYDPITNSWTVYFITFDSLWSVNGSESDIVVMKDYPFRHRTLRFLGSCNGLVFLCMFFNSTFQRAICFWNPATQEYKAILLSRRIYAINISAFGYDCKADDYKLIILDETGTELFVYMLGSDTWESSQPVPYTFLDEPQTGILVNGAFHWLGHARQKNLSKLIVVLDFRNEKFNEFQLSEELLEKKHLPMTIGVLEGCLCVVITVSKVCWEVWVMQDYAAQESWTPRYTFDYCRYFIADYDALKIISSFRNGHILLRVANELFIYDPKDPRGKKPKSFSCSKLLNSVYYVESLVSLNSGTYAVTNEKVVSLVSLNSGTYYSGKNEKVNEEEKHVYISRLNNCSISLLYALLDLYSFNFSLCSIFLSSVQR